MAVSRKEAARLSTSLRQLSRAILSGQAVIKTYREDEQTVQSKIRYKGRATVYILVNLDAGEDTIET
jgi:hypothetical protein